MGNGLIGVGKFSHSCRFILFAEINFGFRCVFCGNVVSLLVELQCGTGCLCFCFGCCGLLNRCREMKKGFSRFAFYWGSVFGCGVFLFQILSAVLHFSGNFFQTLAYSLIVISSLIFVYTKFRRENPSLQPGFGRSLGLLSLVSLVMSLFFTLYTVVLIAKINPSLIQDALNQMAVLAEWYGDYAEVLQDDGVYRIVEVAFVFSNFFFDFLGNFFYSLLIAFMFTRNAGRRLGTFDNGNGNGQE